MAHRTAGTLCTSNTGTEWIDGGTLARSRSNPPGVLGTTPGAGLYDLHFEVRDRRTGLPLRHTPYKLSLASGETVLGITDASGHTQRIAAMSAVIATLEIPYHGHRSGDPDPGEQHSPCAS